MTCQLTHSVTTYLALLLAFIDCFHWVIYSYASTTCLIVVLKCFLMTTRVNIIYFKKKNTP